MGLVPNIYTQMPAGVVLTRDMKTILLPSSFTLVLALIYLIWHKRIEKQQLQAALQQQRQ